MNNNGENPVGTACEHASVHDQRGSVSLQCLRKDIQTNRVSFPVPVPIFACQHRADIQWRLVELYFVHGWSCKRLGRRYQVTDRRIQQLIQRWVTRAKALGYLQTIPAEEPRWAAAAIPWRRDSIPDTSDLVPAL